MDALVSTVVYTGEPDEVFEFAQDGQARLFGRDDTLCEIVVWSALNGADLSRVAGRIWRMDGELWLRNLSTRHELEIRRPGLPAETPLPPRRDDGFDPGAARSIPGDLAYVLGPGGCELVVQQRRRPVAAMDPDTGQATSRVPPVPDGLRLVAASLCEPLLRGGQLPATYSEIMRRTGTRSLKRARTLVAELCAPYVQEIPQLRERIVARIEREQRELGLPADPRLRGAVWSFEAAPNQPPSDEDERRRRALALPDYYEVAHLLVRRRLVTTADLSLLEASAAANDDGTPFRVLPGEADG